MQNKTVGAKVPPSGFSFGETSRKKLAGVHPHLVAVLERALSRSRIDFGVHSGARTTEQQRRLVAAGLSKVLDSRHVPMSTKQRGNGFSHAADVHPYVRDLGGAVWDWPAFVPIAEAVRSAAIELGIPVRWGGVWTKNLNDLDADLQAEHDRYVVDFKSRNHRAPFIDGPHFELPAESYPKDLKVADLRSTAAWVSGLPSGEEEAPPLEPLEEEIRIADSSDVLDSSPKEETA